MMYDVVVIGAGPGGYVAAIRAAQLGLKTACIEKGSALGGTCLNVGCIPSKTLLHASELFHRAQHKMAGFGVISEQVSLDLGVMMGKKDEVVRNLTSGIAHLFKKNRVDHIQGHARFVHSHLLEVEHQGSKTRVEGKHVIIATGSAPIELPFLPFDEADIVSSTGALSFAEVPKRLAVIGGGVIGLELGSVWQRLGSEVVVIEFMDRIAPGMDGDLSKELQRQLKREGMKFHLSTKVTGLERTEQGLVLSAEAKGGEARSFSADKVLVCVGRKPYTADLGLAQIGLDLDEKGRIPVNHDLQTNLDGVYAVGDVIVGPMLAHKAEEEGVAVAERIAGQAGHVNYDAIPNIIYTWPEVASVGKTEEELKGDQVAYRSGKFSFKANARGRCIDESVGFVKILADERSDRILGGHIVGPNASELIQELVLAMEFGASSEDVARTVHGHPTLYEAVKEAALAVDNRPIHF